MQKIQLFFTSLLNRKYDVIIDFMVYSTDELERRLPELLSHTGQYCFFSSSRVYAESKKPITEDSPRLLDACTDQEYLYTDEYALAKAREEICSGKAKRGTGPLSVRTSLIMIIGFSWGFMKKKIGSTGHYRDAR